MMAATVGMTLMTWKTWTRISIYQGVLSHSELYHCILNEFVVGGWDIVRATVEPDSNV